MVMTGEMQGVVCPGGIESIPSIWPLLEIEIKDLIITVTN